MEAKIRLPARTERNRAGSETKKPERVFGVGQLRAYKNIKTDRQEYSEA